ncbi:MAG TPA: PLP-dependent aminotransferase family protein [Rectinemataceae bacterium]|nr:PLP-dependent aminotransferase family protein [Rectinemataceae bacterium]
MTDFSSLYSQNALNMKKSIIRELLKLTNKPGLISFAGGLPAPETFPVADLRVAADAVFTKNPEVGLQYGTTEGDAGLKAELVKIEAEDGVVVGLDNILVTSASQQALDILPKVFVDPGDWIIAGHPTYLGTIQAIQSYRGNILGIPFAAEEDGFDLGEMERRYAAHRASGKSIKYIYVIPDFQNPTGICWSLEKRKALLRFAYRESLLVVEDSPYREIRFVGEHIPSLYQLDQQMENRGIVIGLKTFSKILIPGARMGWIIAHPELIAKFVVAKQAMDLCTNVFTQRWIAEFLATGKLRSVIENTRKNYRAKRMFMLEQLEKHMPKHPGIHWTKPEGGLFLWLSLPAAVDTDAMFTKAIAKNVAYVVGSAFYFDEVEHNSMRLNFSFSSIEEIEEGIKRLAEVVREEIGAK